MKVNRIVKYFLPPTDKPLLNKSNRLAVIFILAVGCYGIIFSFWDLMIGLYNTSFVNLCVTFISVTSLIIIKKEKFLFAKILMTAGITSVLCAHFILFKQQTFVLGYIVPLNMCSVVVFRGKHFIPGLITGLICQTILITLIVSNYHAPIAYVLNPRQLLEQQLINFGGVTLLCLLISYSIIKTNEDIHKAILNQSKIIRESNSTLKETIKTRDKLFSLIAHDLKGPFQSMSASLEILSATDTSTQDKEMVITHLSKKAENTIILLNNLLLWSQHQTDTIKFRPETIKLNTAKTSILEQFKIQAYEKKISINIDFGNFQAVFADKNMFDCIMRNLISNSIKFTHEGGEISIKSYVEGLSTRFVVSDNGIGMDELVKEMLLNKQSYSSAGTNREQGHGLGMMLIHEFLKMHKSELKIETEKGKGSLFSFSLNNA